MRIAAFGLALALLPFAARSQYEQTLGDLTVHYSALSTAHLLPDMAKHYAIARSESRGLVNVAIERSAADGKTTSVRAIVSGKAKSLGGDVAPIAFRELVEDGTVSYIGEFALSAPDTYTFTLTLTPENGAAQTLKFSQDFVAD
jgi:hypothetical protein